MDKISRLHNIKYDFIEDARGNRKSENTILGYNTDIEKFIEFIVEEVGEEESIENIKLRHIKKFIAQLGNATHQRGGSKPRKYSVGTINRAISTLKAFFKYLLINEYITSDPTQQVEKLKGKDREPSYLNITEIKNLFEVISGQNEIRDRAIITMFLDTGLRLSELQNLKIHEIDFENKTLLVVGKGEKQRRIYFSDNTLQSIEEYLETRNDDVEYLFISQRIKKMHKSSIESVINKNLEKAGIRNATTHSLRHTFATMQYTQTGNIMAVKEALGHSCVSTTNIYTHVDDEVLRDMAENNLLGNIVNG